MTTPTRCERTWPSSQGTVTNDSYRQHRCGLEPGHAALACKCRYCGLGRDQSR